MRISKTVVSIGMAMAMVITLVGCGGGSSSSGGGESTSATPYAGSYGGTYNITVSAAGTSMSNTGPIQMVVNSDGTVVIDPHTDMPSHGTIAGKNVTVRVPASVFNSEGISCSGTVVITATESGGKFNGKFGPGRYHCNGVEFAYSGTFTVTKFAKTPRGESIGEFARSAAFAVK